MTTDKEEAWEKMCDVAEALGLIVPETVPYLVTHARKLRERLTLAENMLKLVVDLDHAYHSGWQGIVASQGNVAAAAKELIYGSDETAEKVYNIALSQYESAKETRPLSLSEELERIADELRRDWPNHARELKEIAKGLSK